MHNDRAAQIIGRYMDRERREAARSRRISRAMLAAAVTAVAATLTAPPPAAAGQPPTTPAAIIREIWDWLTGRPPQQPPTPPRPLVKTKLVVGGSEG
ncbi:MAG: hypothetical protein L6Q35_00540 [Phycisphaerales bacterium]|nr:hypothetical protein [Phycisphaerales bacterium]